MYQSKDFGQTFDFFSKVLDVDKLIPSFLSAAMVFCWDFFSGFHFCFGVSGLVVEYMTRDRGVAGSSLTDVTVLCL